MVCTCQTSHVWNIHQTKNHHFQYWFIDLLVDYRTTQNSLLKTKITLLRNEKLTWYHIIASWKLKAVVNIIHLNSTGMFLLLFLLVFLYHPISHFALSAPISLLLTNRREDTFEAMVSFSFCNRWGYKGTFLLMLLLLLVNHCMSSHMLYTLHRVFSCKWRQLKTLGGGIPMILGEVRSCLCCYSYLSITPYHLVFITPCTYVFAGLKDGTLSERQSVCLILNNEQRRVEVWRISFVTGKAGIVRYQYNEYHLLPVHSYHCCYYCLLLCNFHISHSMIYLALISLLLNNRWRTLFERQHVSADLILHDN